MSYGGTNILGREEILERINANTPDKRLVVMPLLDCDTQVGAASIDLRLGTSFIETRRPHFHGLTGVSGRPAPSKESELRFSIPVGATISLHPGEFLLGATLEFLQLPPDLGAQILARSSWGRMGLVVATAVTVQPGFRGCLTLELANEGVVPLPLRPGVRIAQLVLWATGRPVVAHYRAGQARYGDRLGPETSLEAQDSDEDHLLQRIGERLAGRSRPSAVSKAKLTGPEAAAVDEGNAEVGGPAKE